MFKKTKKFISTVAVVAIMTMSLATVVHAGSFSMSAHSIRAGVTMTYYDGNGFSLAEGDTLYLNADLQQEYSWSSGARNVTTGSSYTENSGSSSAIDMNFTAPKTALYKAWIKNTSSVTMYVDSGSISY